MEITPEEIEKRFGKLTPEEKAELIIGSAQMKVIQKKNPVLDERYNKIP